MRGQYLFQERRAGAWQPQYENWIGARRTHTLAVREEFARANLDLPVGVGFDDLRVVADFGPLELVTLFVIAPGFRILAPILEGLAEREAQMIAVNPRSARRGFCGAHAPDLVVCEAIGLEIGEAPIGVAEVRAGGGRRTVGMD